MKSFLLELAELIIKKNLSELDSLTFVFPNRRAALYFRKHLSSLLTKPSFAPKLVTIEDFIAGYSALTVPDKLELIYHLYNVYNVVSEKRAAESGQTFEAETFDQFYFWGEMLLRDFDELDKYMADALHLFKDLSNQKELDAGFDFLTDEQRKFLESFWLSFDEKDSVNKTKFLHIWRQLPEVYTTYKVSLQSKGLAYDGMLHRAVAESIASQYQADNLKHDRADGPAIWFVGFNALTRCEEEIISFFVDQEIGTVHWDVDAYYMHNNTQEAGKFLRKYQQHPTLGKTFLADIPANFKTQTKINLFGASQPLSQAKLLAQLVQEKIKAGYNPEETLIVLPDEKLLMPVLHGVAGVVEKLNVTMGFPISSTPLYNLVELLIEMHINKKDECFNHRQVIALLGHPYVVAADAAVAQAKRKEILETNRVMVAIGFLNSAVVLHRIIFKTFVPEGNNSNHEDLAQHITHYLKDIIIEIGKLANINDLDKEYCFHFIRLLNRITEVTTGQTTNTTAVSEPTEDKMLKRMERDALKSFLRLFRQLVRAEKIPFLGEPLKGLQIMGVLETRNLDFKNVFILSLNEGVFPSFSSKGSYIPFNIRKAYGLPTVEHQDAMYAYLFYSMLQRAENIFLIHNSETDDLGQGELSRYVQQLVYESGIDIERNVLHNPLQPKGLTSITVDKEERVFQALAKYCLGVRENRPLSPSALNDYLECRLRFYFKYVAGIREAKEVEEDLDARVLGNFLHRVMELFYQRIINIKGDKDITVTDIAEGEKHIDTLIDGAFIKNYALNPEKAVVYEGQRLVVKEIVKRFINRIIEIDKKYAPFTIEALERRDINYTMRLSASGNPSVVLGGSIDRADRKDNVVRIIDYKTGKDETAFNDVLSLFNRDSKRNKAAFQTMLYTLLYKKSTPSTYKLVPGLLNRINLFNADFVFGFVQGGNAIQDATPLLAEFEGLLKVLLEEIFNPEIPFDQTTELEYCKYCPYQRICYR